MQNDNSKVKPLIDSRMMKIIAAKKSEFKDAVVIIHLNSDDNLDSTVMENCEKLIENMEKLEPDGSYLLMLADKTTNMSMSIYNKSDFKNQNLIVTVKPQNDIDTEQLEEDIRNVLSTAKSVEIVYADLEIKEV